MFNLHSSLEQQKKKESKLKELKTDLYSLGFFDGIIGSEPTKPEKNSYWEGYQLGSREYWSKMLGVVIPAES